MNYTSGMVRKSLPKANRIHIAHIKLGFLDIVTNKNYSDSHRPLAPFGMKWGRSLLVRGETCLEAITDSYLISHSMLKKELKDGDKSGGSFYFGYEGYDRTLYLEYASDRMFDFHGQEVIDAIMNSLRHGNEPFKDFILDGK